MIMLTRSVIKEMDAYLEEQLVFFTCFMQNPNALDFEMRKQGDY